MDANVRGLNQAVRNANDGISLAQTAEGAMGNISNILVRMRELAVQASNGTLGTEDRAAIQTEVTALVSQIGDIAERTTFNGTDLLEGGASIDIQTGVNSGEKVTIAIADLQANAIGEVDGTGALVAGSAVSDIDLSTAADASTALGILDDAIQTVATERANLGAQQNRLEATVDTIGRAHVCTTVTHAQSVCRT